MNVKEEAVLVAATKLFSEFGYHAVGVDTIIANSNVAKMTFYKYFPSKDDLIQRVLIRRDETMRRGIENAVSRRRTPTGKLKAVFDWHEAWFSSPDFHGCMFIKASEEFPADNSEVRLISQNHKDWLTGLIEGLLTDIGAQRSRQLARHLMIVLDGLTIDSNMYNSRRRGHTKASWAFIMRIISSETL